MFKIVTAVKCIDGRIPEMRTGHFNLILYDVAVAGRQGNVGFFVLRDTDDTPSYFVVYSDPNDRTVNSPEHEQELRIALIKHLNPEPRG